MRFGPAGIPSEFSTDWTTKVLIASHTKLAGVQVPQPHIASITEYVRFLLGSVSDVLRVARQPATVNRPVETLLLFPDPREALSTRYWIWGIEGPFPLRVFQSCPILVVLLIRNPGEHLAKT